jgi:hypothetical protein
LDGLVAKQHVFSISA